MNYKTVLALGLPVKLTAEQSRFLLTVIEKNEAEIDALKNSLSEITPALPPKNAICHVGIIEQKDCSYCSRVLKARKLLGFNDKI